MSLTQLPSDVQEYLRSGLTVENFTQCVDELVMNSIDAGATSVKVNINLNSFTIEVIDNGEGLKLEQLNSLCIRYMTSRCRSLNDLNKKPCYYGYRGEALASIRNIVEELIIISKDSDSGNTYSKVFYSKNSAPTQLSSETLKSGTIVLLNNIFNNHPIRRKLIKQSFELEKIRSHLEMMSLINPSVSFHVRDVNTGNIVLKRKPSHGIATSFSLLFKLPNTFSLIPINVGNSIFEINGFISMDIYSDTNEYQFIYINKRVLKKSILHNILNENLSRFHNTIDKLHLFPHRGCTINKNLFSKDSNYSVYIINIQCPNTEYSINCSSPKTVIDFLNWDYLLRSLVEALSSALQLTNLTKEIILETDSAKHRTLNNDKEKSFSVNNFTIHENIIEERNKKSGVIYGDHKQRFMAEDEQKNSEQNVECIYRVKNDPFTPVIASLDKNESFFTRLFYYNSLRHINREQQLAAVNNTSSLTYNYKNIINYSHKFEYPFKYRRKKCLFSGDFHEIGTPYSKMKYININVAKHILKNTVSFDNITYMCKAEQCGGTMFNKNKYPCSNKKNLKNLDIRGRVSTLLKYSKTYSFHLMTNLRAVFGHSLFNNQLLNINRLMRRDQNKYSKILKLLDLDKKLNRNYTVSVVSANKKMGNGHTTIQNYQHFNITLQNNYKDLSFNDYKNRSLITSTKHLNKETALMNASIISDKTPIKLKNTNFISGINGMSHPMKNEKNVFEIAKRCFFAKKHINYQQGMGTSQNDLSTFSCMVTEKPRRFCIETYLKGPNCNCLPAVKEKNRFHSYIFQKDLFNTLNIMGQVDNKYIAAISNENLLCEENRGLILLFDQHAVDERIRFEALLSKFNDENGAVHRTKFITPLKLTLQPNLVDNILLNKLHLKNMGLIFKPINNSDIMITAVPTWLLKYLKNKPSKEIVLERIIKLIVNGAINSPRVKGKLTRPDIVNSMLSSEACKGAIKFGKELSLTECNGLVKNLALCNTPFQCAHGRPLLAPIVHITLLKNEGLNPTFGNLSKKMQRI